MANTGQQAAPEELGGGYQQFQDRMEQQRQRYATRWLYSPLIRVNVQSFPGLNIPGGRVTPLSGEMLAKHYGIKDLDAELVENSGGLIQLTTNGKNYFHYVPPAEVSDMVVQQNAVAGVVELVELRGVPASEADKINRALFGDEFEPAPARIQRLNALLQKTNEPSITATANRCAVTTQNMQREALGTVQRAKARMATPGNTTTYDPYELLCFDFTGEPLSDTDRQGIGPAQPPDNPMLNAVVEQNAKLQERLLAIEAQNAKNQAQLISIFAQLAGPAPAKDETETPTPAKGKK